MTKHKVKVGVGDRVEVREIDVPDGELAPWDADTKFRSVGTNVPRVDGEAKATGRAEYTADVRLPGMLHARMFRAAQPGGKLTSLDVSAAEKAPGVRMVRVLAQPGRALKMEGQDLALVVADTEAQAEDALLLCKAKWDQGPVYATPEVAMAAGAVSIHEGKENNVRRAPAGGGRQGGDPFARAEEAIQAADFVIERTYRTQVQTHSPLEPHGIVVRPDEDGGITVWASTQGTFSVRDGFANSLRIQQPMVRVITEFMGGGFGTKFGPSSPGSGFGVETARAAIDLKRPVRCMLDRREQHLCGGNRPSSVQTVKLGVTKAGKITGYTVRMYGTGGLAEQGAGARNPMIYNLGATAVESSTVVTHAGPQAAFRAPGHPQGSFALEQAVDEAAHAIGADPLAFRRGIDGSSIRAHQYEEGAKLFDWAAKRSRYANQKGAVRRGVGVAAGIWHQPGGSGATVLVTVHRDGSVEVTNGAQDIGTGTRTVLAVIVAEVLGMDPHAVRVNLGRTEWPFGPGSGGSTTAPSIGPCARDAAEQAKRAILGASFEGVPTASQWKAACRKMDVEEQVFSGKRSNQYASFHNGTAGLQFAEVEVDTDTGVVRVLSVLAMQDCGRVIDRLTAESQVIGGVIGGISYALFEDRRLDPKTGRLLHGDLEGYRIAGARDCPDIRAVMTDVSNAGNAAGMMGLGEAPSVPTAGAIANAVFHATGARVREIPMTPARVLAALDAAAASKNGGR
ncbi:MAG: putative xanthine dehydrogenase molybdenum-binding subunit XdhA [Planctomycetes bacterium]|nr:putative xanthine dehydrogenase molybdenum-binding subunit XdhA [Planctomycetota bacterium]